MLIKIIIKDIESLLEDWRNVCKDRKLLDNTEYLNKIHNHILLLDQHSQKLSEHKQLHELIYHILHTPPGAPAATTKTLYDAASSYSNEDAKNSDLRSYLKKSIETSGQRDNYLFNSLYIP